MPPAASANLQAQPALAPRRTRRARPSLEPASPVVKWAGGKTKLLEEILQRRPARFRRYYEPFLGGGAVFFRMAPAQAVLADVNADLMNTYRCIAQQVDDVIRRLTVHRERHDEAYYYGTRERWNQRTGAQADVDRAAMFIYLNKTCYNGLYRVNRKGLFNVPMGRYSAPRIFEPEALRAASRLLARADLRCGTYEAAVDSARAGDFVYFDPPYQPVSSTANFTSYTADSFGEKDQARLAEVARSLAERGVSVMVSNSDTPLIRELYDGFQIDRVLCARAINSRASSRGSVAEVLITA